MAQSAPTSEPTASIDDVIVTARRREERLQDVPLAVSVVTPETLERANITNVSGLQTQTPSLVITPGLGANKSTPSFAIRGQSQQELTILADPSVSLYIGDIVAPRSQGANGALFDLASVQVLKGPQGTLFGRNSTGGIVQLTPNLPTNEFGGHIGVTYGNFGTLNTQAVVNMPLTDTLAARLAVTNNTSDGYLYDVLRGTNVNFIDNQALRASLRWTPSEAFTNVLVVDAFHSNEGGAGTFIRNVRPGGSFDSLPARTARNYPTLESMLADQVARGNRRTASGTPTFSQVDTLTIANTSSFELSDSITVKNIFGYRSVTSHNYEDTDGLPIPLLEIERIFDQDQYSNELQIFGETGNLNWIIGGFYFREEASDQGLSVTGGVDPGAIQPTSILAYPAYSNTWVLGENTSSALFAQGTYEFPSLPGLSLTAGIRQNWDERVATIQNRTQAACRFTIDADQNPATPEVAVASLAACSLPLSVDFSEPTWNVSLDYKVNEDSLIYLAHRHGYRTGGFGARAATEAGLRRTFRPEIVDDIEGGLKVDWDLGGEAFLRTNIAVYYSAYEDIQRLLTDPTTIPITTVTVNAQKAHVKGGEFEFVFRPNQLIEFSGFWSHTEAAFDEFIAPGNINLSANPFARTPENTWSLSARVTPDLPSNVGELALGASYFHSDEFNANDTPALFNDVQAYNLLNLNAEWSNVYGTPVTISAYVTNALDEEYSFSMLNIHSSLGFESRTPGEPRSYGVRLKYDF
jgi:iron complex outermembrane receptor protein